MIRCKKCKAVLKEPTVRWQVIFHGSLVEKEGKWELEPWGENDYVDSLILECDSCGYEVKIKINGEEINCKHLEEVVRKFAGVEK
ncbi:MAG: hypothetical protein N2V78_12100 [Methanophagales archaeon]|nr:hypothetical protein [Methanophagales archaeon]